MSESYDSGGKRDPFVPLISGEKEAVRGLYGIETMDDLRIDGIVFDPASGSAAIVNGEIVREGDVRENLKVIKIQPDGVLFGLNDNQDFLKFGNDE